MFNKRTLNPGLKVSLCSIVSIVLSAEQSFKVFFPFRQRVSECSFGGQAVIHRKNTCTIEISSVV